MVTRKRLIKVGLVVGVLGLIMLFPARVAYRWFAPPEVLLSGIEGTVWNGSAREASVDDFYLRDLHWQFRPLALFTAKIGYSLETKFASGFMEGDFAVGFGQNLKAKNVRAALPLESLQYMVPLAGARGSLSANLSALRIADGLPVEADGSVEIAGLALPLVHRDPIGGFKAEFFTQEAGISASIEDTAAVIDVAGSLQLGDDGTYQFLAQVGALDNTPPAIREQLRFLGSPNDRGRHELRLEGQL